MLYEDMKDKFAPCNFPFISMMFTDCSSFSNHCHKELEIMYVLSGTLNILYNQEIYLLEEGELFIIPPFTNHAYLEPSSDSRRLAVEIDLDIADTTFSQDNDTIPYKNRLLLLDMYSPSWDKQIKAEVAEIVLKMHDEYMTQDYAWKFAIKTLTCQLLLIAVREFPSRQTAEKDKQIARLQSSIEYIATHFDKNISLNECAEIAGFNPSYFSRYFRKNMGMTFQDYVKNSKIERAKWLLLSTALPIVDICYQSGFSDIRTFNKIFKKEVAESPSSYRKNHAK